MSKTPKKMDWIVWLSLIFLLCRHVRAEQDVFTNSWAVEVVGGDSAADDLAERHGFSNLGKVSLLFFKLFFWCYTYS